MENNEPFVLNSLNNTASGETSMCSRWLKSDSDAWVIGDIDVFGMLNADD